jgi:hypothetical protein
MSGRKGTYPKADRHISISGLRVSELSVVAKVSEKSILRVRRQEEVLATTIQRIINALNEEYFNPKKNQVPLEFDREFVPAGDGSGAKPS